MNDNSKSSKPNDLAAEKPVYWFDGEERISPEPEFDYGNTDEPTDDNAAMIEVDPYPDDE